MTLQIFKKGGREENRTYYTTNVSEIKVSATKLVIASFRKKESNDTNLETLLYKFTRFISDFIQSCRDT